MITKLQPHFLAIWTFQSWNLAYNVSVEWDAPEDKYHWIKKGIQFVQQGVKQEPEVARPGLGHGLVLLPQARVLRRVDHPPPALPRRRGPRLQAVLRPRVDRRRLVGDDNFKLGYGWFSRAVRMVDDGENGWSHGTAETRPVRRPRRAAEGPPRRHPLPVDAGHARISTPRCSRRRASTASPPASARRPAASGATPWTSGSSSASTSSRCSATRRKAGSSSSTT